jgi:hypothetical protein
VTVQVSAVPEQAPVHPVKTAFAPGCAVNVTCVPAGRVTVQLSEQLLVLPLRVALIVPEPVLR